MRLKRFSRMSKRMPFPFCLSWRSQLDFIRKLHDPASVNFERESLMIVHRFWSHRKRRVRGHFCRWRSGVSVVQHSRKMKLRENPCPLGASSFRKLRFPIDNIEESRSAQLWSKYSLKMELRNETRMSSLAVSDCATTQRLPDSRA